MPPHDWKALAAAVTARRQQLGLNQGDLVNHKGPSRETVRHIELADRDNYRQTTFTQLDAALGWRWGTAAAIAEGTADMSDPESWNRDITRTITDRADTTSSVAMKGESHLGVGASKGPVIDTNRAVDLLSGTLHAMSQWENRTPGEEQALACVRQAMRVAFDDSFGDFGD